MSLSRFILLFFLSQFNVALFSQNIVKNGSFEEIDSCSILGNGSPFNRPTHWFSSLKNSNDIVVCSNTSNKLCVSNLLFKAFDGSNALKLGFKVTTSKVSTQFIQSELERPLIKDSAYRISLKIRKNVFSIGSIQELQLLFTPGKIASTIQYSPRMLEHAILKFSVDSLSNKEWNSVSIDYYANGSEYYVSLGSFSQHFNLKNGMKNYQAERILQESNEPNALYFIDDFKIESIQNLNGNSRLKEIENANIQNLLYTTLNLVTNSGFEYSRNAISQSLEYYPKGVEIVPGWLSLGISDASIYVVDSNSNFYRYNKLNGNYPYMGNGIAEVTILNTNKHHNYKQVWAKHEGTDYTRIYKYENTPSQNHIRNYEYGSYLVGSLRNSLEKDSSYMFSFMSKLSSASSFGVKYIGVYFRSQIPKDFTDSLFEETPNLLFDVSLLSKKNQWEECTGFYKALGNESYFIIGYYYSKENSVIKNYGFERVLSSSCGPNYTNGTYCLHYEATYYDSLFARFYFDNFLMRKVDGIEQRGASIFDLSKVNQTQWIFDFGGSKNSNKHLEKVQHILIESMKLMRIDDGIAITYLNKTSELKLSPTTYENKRKIIRLVNQYKINIKPGYTSFQDYTLLFDGNQSKGFNNNVILITDGHLNVEKGIGSIERFCKSGGKFTILYIGEQESKMNFTSKLSSLEGIKIFSIEENSVFENLIRDMQK